MCNLSTSEWTSAIQEGKQDLFTIERGEDGSPRMQLLTIQERISNVGRMKRGIVEGLWAGMNLELLFFDICTKSRNYEEISNFKINV